MIDPPRRKTRSSGSQSNPVPNSTRLQTAAAKVTAPASQSNPGNRFILLIFHYLESEFITKRNARSFKNTSLCTQTSPPTHIAVTRLASMDPMTFNGVSSKHSSRHSSVFSQAQSNASSSQSLEMSLSTSSQDIRFQRQLPEESMASDDE